MRTNLTLIINIRKKHLNISGHIIRIDDLENLTLTEHIEGRMDRGRQHITSLCKRTAK